MTEAHVVANVPARHAEKAENIFRREGYELEKKRSTIKLKGTNTILSLPYDISVPESKELSREAEDVLEALERKGLPPKDEHIKEVAQELEKDPIKVLADIYGIPEESATVFFYDPAFWKVVKEDRHFKKLKEIVELVEEGKKEEARALLEKYFPEPEGVSEKELKDFVNAVEKVDELKRRYLFVQYTKPRIEAKLQEVSNEIKEKLEQYNELFQKFEELYKRTHQIKDFNRRYGLFYDITNNFIDNFLNTLRKLGWMRLQLEDHLEDPDKAGRSAELVAEKLFGLDAHTTELAYAARTAKKYLDIEEPILPITKSRRLKKRLVRELRNLIDEALAHMSKLNYLHSTHHDKIRRKLAEFKMLLEEYKDLDLEKLERELRSTRYPPLPKEELVRLAARKVAEKIMEEGVVPPKSKEREYERRVVWMEDVPVKVRKVKEREVINFAIPHIKEAVRRVAAATSPHHKVTALYHFANDGFSRKALAWALAHDLREEKSEHVEESYLYHARSKHPSLDEAYRSMKRVLRELKDLNAEIKHAEIREEPET